MANKLQHNSHSVGEENLHLQFTAAYRRDIFAHPLVRELTVAYIMQRAQQLKIELAAIECGPDHIHLFASNWKNYSIAVLAGQLKTYSSRMMRRGHKPLIEHKLWGKKFWSAGYFRRTVGEVTAETVKRCIKEGQRKHWEEQAQKQQTTLYRYTS